MAVFPSDSIRTKNWGTEILTDSDLEAQLDLLHAYFTAALNSSTGHNHDGTSNQGPKLPVASLTVASQAQGDILYASSASAWTRLGAGTNGQFLKTQGAAANPTWANLSAKNFRAEMLVTQASTTTMSVSPGNLEVNGAIVEKTSATTLTISTAGDYAGGSSLRATSTYGYVGVDSAGNIKMHTTAPSHSDYGVAVTAGTKRYATWSGTVYRIIGWFYMNATGSGELNAWEVGNLKDGTVPNSVSYYTTNTQALSDTSDPPDTDITDSTIHFYSSGRPVMYDFLSYGTGSGTSPTIRSIHNFDGTNIANSKKVTYESSAGGWTKEIINTWQDTPAQGPHTYKMQGSVDGSSYTFVAQTYRLTEI